MRFVLRPFGLGSEVLREQFIDTEDKSKHQVIIGRNIETGLDRALPNVQFVSRQHVILRLKSDRIYVDAVSRQDNLVYLNGEPCGRGEKEVRSGDEICLLGSLGYYNYRIAEDQSPPLKRSKTEHSTLEIPLSNALTATPSKLLPVNTSLNTTVDEVNSIKVPHPSSSSGSVASLSALPASPNKGMPPTHTPVVTEKIVLKEVPDYSRMRKLLNTLLQHYECEICFEPIACSYSLLPCGDTFCYSCIEDWSKSSRNQCPHCQGEFNLDSAFANKKMDSVVRDILQSTVQLEEEIQTNAGDAVANASFVDKAKQSLQSWDQRNDDGISARKQAIAAAAASAAAAEAAASRPPPPPGSILTHFRFTNPPAATAAAVVNGAVGARPVPVIELANSQNGRNNGGRGAGNANRNGLVVMDLTRNDTASSSSNSTITNTSNGRNAVVTAGNRASSSRGPINLVSNSFSYTAI